MADEPTSKKLLEKQQRRKAEEERRRAQQKAARKRNLVTLGIALLISAIVVFFVIRETDRGGGGTVGVASAEAGCTDVEEHEIEGQEHVEVAPQYGTNPPTSGNHLQTPASPGFVEEPLDPGALVHNMEHGQIIFWYDPSAPDATIDEIEDIVDQQFDESIAVPWEPLEGPYSFAMTAWGASQHCRQVSQAVVDNFREEYQGKGPEAIPGIDMFEADAD